MAFMKELIPENERCGYMIPGYKEIFPRSWVIDKNNNIKLFRYWQNIEEPHEEYFALIIEQQIFKVVMIKDFVDENTVRWKLYTGLNETEEILQILREAMQVYHLGSNPLVHKETSGKTVIDF